MNNPQKSNGSFFETIADTIRPGTPKTHDRIVKLDYDLTIDKIVVTLGLSWHHIGHNVNRTQIIVIEKDDFEQWCDTAGRFFISSDMTEDAHEVEVSFAEFMDDHVTKSDIQDYIIDKNLTDYGWAL